MTSPINQVAMEGTVSYRSYNRHKPIRSEDAFDIMLIDLEWAGPEGKATYPVNMASPSIGTPWHSTALPGQALQREHDSHLQKLFK